MLQDQNIGPVCELNKTTSALVGMWGGANETPNARFPMLDSKPIGMNCILDNCVYLLQGWPY